MKTVNLKGTKRSDLGTNAAKQLRRDGHIPCVVYGGEENVHFFASMKELKGLVYTPEFSKVVVEVDGNTYETIIKDFQFEPVTDKLIHLDFQQLIAGRKVKTEIPIILEGTPAGVKEGGKLIQKMRRMKVKGLPKDLLDAVVIDVTSLELGKSARVSDAEVGDLEVMHSPSIPVASVEIPRAVKSAEAEAEAAAEGAAGEAAEGAEGAEGDEGAKE